MFFNDISELPTLAAKTSCAIFVLSDPSCLKINNSRTLSPAANKKSIGVEEVRAFTEHAAAKREADHFMIISPADALTTEAQNALLKNLEEPRPHYHYLLITRSPAVLLPTVRSRAALYCQKITGALEAPIAASEKVAATARALITAAPRDLPDLATKIAKDKNPRVFALEVAATAIEILEKSYFKTGKTAFLKKLPTFLALADALEQNGHVKLHIVADLC